MGIRALTGVLFPDQPLPTSQSTARTLALASRKDRHTEISSG